MKGKIIKNTLESLINILSKKNSKEQKINSLKKLGYSSPFIIAGGTLNIIAMNKTPLEVINFFNEVGVDPFFAAMGLYTVGSSILLADKEVSPLQEEIAQYGSDYCPYQSFEVASNDLKGKAIQMKINSLYNLSFRLGRERTISGRITKFVAEKSEKFINSYGEDSKKILDFFGKGEHGFELLSHNNPRLVRYMPVSKALKKAINPETMDLDNADKREEERFVFECRERTMLKTKEEILDRNVVLALVKVIDKIKMKEDSKSDLKVLDKIKTLRYKTSEANIKKSEEITRIAKILSNKDKIKEMKIPNWEKKDTHYLRAFHILKELDRIALENNLTRLKKPITYRELYRNALVMSIQFKLRTPYEQKNLSLQNEAPLIKEHFENAKKDYYKELLDFKVTKLVGTKEEDFPLIKYLEESVDENEKEIKIKESPNIEMPKEENIKLKIKETKKRRRRNV